MKVLVTGSAGLVGSEAVRFYAGTGWDVCGMDNNFRRVFFGDAGDTTWNRDRLGRDVERYRHLDVDIRDEEGVEQVFRAHHFDLVVHCAAQPSHDKASQIPRLDFSVNASGTLNLLEATRQFAPDAVFIYVSTNKVYGDAPNELPLVELDTRWDYARPQDYDGISEQCRIDQTLHSLFGASKLAGDVLAQEYGRYFGLKTGIFRGGCLTGAAHSGVELHGFLSYLVKAAVRGIPYKVYGYKAKQVRDNLHSSDVVRAFEAFRQNPRPGEVYNLGGGRGNSVSMQEAIERVAAMSGRKLDYQYCEQPRIGDHTCYISDLRKIRLHYPDWDVRVGLDEILQEIVRSHLAAHDSSRSVPEATRVPN